MRMVRWDGAAEFWAESAEDFVAFMKGVYGAKELVGKSLGVFLEVRELIVCHSGCGSRFVDLVKGYEVMGGYDNLILGSGVPVYGRDGISERDSRLKKNVQSQENVVARNGKKDSGIELVVSVVEA
jgi:hypothetical protein